MFVLDGFKIVSGWRTPVYKIGSIMVEDYLDHPTEKVWGLFSYIKCKVTKGDDLVYISKKFSEVNSDCETSMRKRIVYPECIPCMCDVAEELHELNSAFKEELHG